MYADFNHKLHFANSPVILHELGTIHMHWSSAHSLKITWCRFYSLQQSCTLLAQIGLCDRNNLKELVLRPHPLLHQDPVYFRSPERRAYNAYNVLESLVAAAHDKEWCGCVWVQRAPPSFRFHPASGATESGETLRKQRTVFNSMWIKVGRSSPHPPTHNHTDHPHFVKFLLNFWQADDSAWGVFPFTLFEMQKQRFFYTGLPNCWLFV
jgi:hypothetical protein